MNELRRFKHSADFFANSSHIIESAAISASELSTLLTHTGYTANAYRQTTDKLMFKSVISTVR